MYIDPLFALHEIKRTAEHSEDTPPVTFDILREEGGALYLSRDGNDVHVIIGTTYRDHFKRMGELGFLRGKALEMWENDYGGDNRV